MPPPDRPPPKPIDLDPTQYREVDPPRRRGEPFFKRGGLLFVLLFIAVAVAGGIYRHLTYEPPAWYRDLNR